MGLIRGSLPIGYAIGEILIGDGDSIKLLSLFDLHLDLVFLVEIGDLLGRGAVTFESVQPCLIPSLFMATKFLPGSLMEETVCCCHPDTTESKGQYLHVPQTRLSEGPCRRRGPTWAIHGSLS
jgi:hypothetical protein